MRYRAVTWGPLLLFVDPHSWYLAVGVNFGDRLRYRYQPVRATLTLRVLCVGLELSLGSS